MNYYEIGQRIRKFRKAHQLSQEDLAEKIGISTTHMSHIETGNTKLSLPVLVSIATALDVRTDDLLFDHAEMGRNAVMEELLSSLGDCSAQQVKVLSDIVKAAKLSMDKHL
ncbi:MAG: helix-turn-helix transcriptional regulator [Oscillospiraceae bacterium]|nr:helix-turn-helix transcriptional regulator [Oscillospiraceae bacterium]